MLRIECPKCGGKYDVAKGTKTPCPWCAKVKPLDGRWVLAVLLCLVGLVLLCLAWHDSVKKDDLDKLALKGTADAARLNSILTGSFEYRAPAPQKADRTSVYVMSLAGVLLIGFGLVCGVIAASLPRHQPSPANAG